MIAAGRQYVGQADWMTLFPGIAIVLSVLSLQMVGDGFRDLLDPRLKRTCDSCLRQQPPAARF